MKLQNLWPKNEKCSTAYEKNMYVKWQLKYVHWTQFSESTRFVHFAFLITHKYFTLLTNLLMHQKPKIICLKIACNGEIPRAYRSQPLGSYDRYLLFSITFLCTEKLKNLLSLQMFFAVIKTKQKYIVSAHF